MGLRRVGTAFFAVGIVLAIIMGAFADLFVTAVIIAFYWILFGFGLIAGFLNLAKEDAEDILYTAAVILLAAVAAGELSRVAPDVFGTFIVNGAKGIIAFVFPAALVIGAKRIFDLGTGF
ncbi:MAG: hypothetical protein WC254_07160 [Candidatus Woesearchaeota archaeon]|jgi:hypothetical protein